MEFPILYSYFNNPPFETRNINDIKNVDGLNIILNHNLSIFPEKLFDFDKMYSLKILNKNMIIPDDICKLINLRELILTCDTLPNNIYSFEELRFLELINFNGCLSNDINKLKKLEKIVIFGNFILSFDVFLYHPNIHLSIDSNTNNYIMFDNGTIFACRTMITHYKYYNFIIKDYELLRIHYKDKIKKLEDDNKILIKNNDKITCFLDNLIKELKKFDGLSKKPN